MVVWHHVTRTSRQCTDSALQQTGLNSPSGSRHTRWDEDGVELQGDEDEACAPESVQREEVSAGSSQGSLGQGGLGEDFLVGEDEPAEDLGDAFAGDSDPEGNLVHAAAAVVEQNVSDSEDASSDDDEINDAGVYEAEAEVDGYVSADDQQWPAEQEAANDEAAAERTAKPGSAAYFAARRHDPLFEGARLTVEQACYLELSKKQRDRRRDVAFDEHCRVQHEFLLQQPNLMPPSLYLMRKVGCWMYYSCTVHAHIYYALKSSAAAASRWKALRQQSETLSHVLPRSWGFAAWTITSIMSASMMTSPGLT